MEGEENSNMMQTEGFCDLVLEDGSVLTKEERERASKGIPPTNDFLKFRWSDKKNDYIFEGVDIDKVSEYLIKELEIKTIFGKKSDVCFNFDGRIFKEDGRGLIKSKTEEILGVYCKRNVVDEVFEKIKRQTKVDREYFEKINSNLIPLETGVWNIEEKKQIPHNSKHNFRFIIPVKYDESAKCENWLKFINEALYPEDIPVAQEWFGFNLYREYFIKKALICKGARDTGKTIFLDTLTAFIGEGNKTGLSLQKISSGSDFTKLSLKDKHSNIYDDLSSKDLNDGGAFKVATGGGFISAEEKFGDFIQFKSYAKQTFATNKIPPVKDNDDLAYFGRWIIFEFDNVPEKIDPFLRNKLTTPEELSGILNWALEGLYRLLENGKFSYTKEPEEIKQIMEASGCPLVAFGSEVLSQEDGNVISKDDMYQVYSVWCEKSKRPRLSKEMLGRQLDKYVNYIIPEKHKERIWKNAKIKSEWSKILENQEIIPNTDTSDTFKKNMRTFSKREKNDNIMGYINFKKASETPPKFTEEQYKLAGYKSKKDYENCLKELEDGF